MPFCQSVAQQVFLTLSQNVYGCGSTYKLLVRVAPVRVMTMVDKKCMVQENLCRATKCMARLGLSSWARGRHGALTSMQNNACFIDNRGPSVASITLASRVPSSSKLLRERIPPVDVETLMAGADIQRSPWSHREVPIVFAIVLSTSRRSRHPYSSRWCACPYNTNFRKPTMAFTRSCSVLSVSTRTLMNT